MNWILCGFKGCGKSFFGARLSLPFLDLDRLIEERERLCVRDIVLQKGEAYFRKLEKETALSLEVEGHVIAVGGGTLLDPISQAHLRSLGPLIYLKCPKQILKKRILIPPLPTFIKNNDDFEKIYFVINY